MPMQLSVRPVREGEFADYGRASARGFGQDFTESDIERLRKLQEPDRTRCAFDGEQLVGTLGAYTLQIAVPGADTRMGGTTDVTVAPTHRRRGILRAMMQAHLDDVRERGEPLAGLWASEGAIYPRFGFGAAAESDDVTIRQGGALFAQRDTAQQVRMLDADSARSIVKTIYDNVWRARPGMLARDDTWWTERIFRDDEAKRRGATAKCYVISEEQGHPQGYAIYRQRPHPSYEPSGEVQIEEVVCASDEAHDTLWRFLTSIDLFTKVSYWNAPLDDALKWRVLDPFRVQRRTHDNLWVRLMNLEQALTTRRYMGSGKLTLAVFDETQSQPEQRIALDVSVDGSQCGKTKSTPDVSLSLATLSALYMGKRWTHQLARGGLVRGDEKALDTLDQMLGWRQEPWCPEVF